MFINDPSVVEVVANYRGASTAQFFHPATGVVVVAEHSGDYKIVVKLGAEQLENSLLRGGWR